MTSLSKRNYIIKTCLLALILAGLALLSIFYGENASTFVITKLRIPRVTAGILAGIAFGVAGNNFQTLLRNPLASPDIIGVSSGSTAAAVYCILFLHLNRGAVSLLAVVAGILSAFIIYKVADTGRFSAGRLILVGIGFQAVMGAAINWMVMAGAEYDVPTAMRWMSGNLGGITSDALPLLTVVVAASLVILIVLRHDLQSLTLGEELATVLGVPVTLARTGLIILSVTMIAFATAVTGPISSIAFLSGPIAARLNGRNNVNILSSGLIGALLVLGGDFVGQHLLPTRYPVGVITGILGAPYLVYLLVRQNKKGAI